LERFFTYRTACPAVSGITHDALNDFLVSPLAARTPDGRQKEKSSINRMKSALCAFFYGCMQTGTSRRISRQG